VVFREEHVAAISNLAPGIDDGHSVDEGSYGVGARSIRAEFPYVFGTTPGSVSLFIRIEKHKHATRFRVTQILTSDALTSPITWRFSAAGRP
jgi:hypothetical protein